MAKPHAAFAILVSCVVGPADNDLSTSLWSLDAFRSFGRYSVGRIPSWAQTLGTLRRRFRIRVGTPIVGVAHRCSPTCAGRLYQGRYERRLSRGHVGLASNSGYADASASSCRTRLHYDERATGLVLLSIQRDALAVAAPNAFAVLQRAVVQPCALVSFSLALSSSKISDLAPTAATSTSSLTFRSGSPHMRRCRGRQSLAAYSAGVTDRANALIASSCEAFAAFR
jgi:hypothetical protein